MNGLRRRIISAAVWGITGTALVLIAGLAYALGPALYHHYYLFPRQREATRQLQAQRRDIPPLPGWKELIAFNHLASARGFQFWAESTGSGGLERAILGDETPWRPGFRLLVQSPLPCRLTLVRDGRICRQQKGSTWVTEAEEPGSYRLEAELDFMGEWVPWVYTNAITLTTPK